MKKRLLFILITVFAVCTLFTVSVSAEDYPLVNNLGDPEWYTGNYELIADKTSQVVLYDGSTYTAYPSYYVLKYSITVNNGSVSEAYVNGFDYSFVNSKTGKNYTAGAIYKIELPNGLTTVKNTYFGHNPKEPNVVEIVMPDSMTTISSHAFRDTTNLKKVVFSKNLVKIGAYAFYNAKGLEEFVLPAGSDEELDVSSENIFLGCSALKEADLSTRIIKSLGSNFLSECTSLGKVTLPDCLENIGYCSLYKNPNMYLASDFLPSSLKTVGFQFLSGCENSNSVLFFPVGFEGFTGTHCFDTERYKTPDTTLVFLGKMSGDINLGQFHASSGRKMTLVFTQNSFSDYSGTVVTGVDSNGTLAFVGKTADTSDTDYYTQNGTLTLTFGNASESNSKLGADENGNTLYYVNKNGYTVYFCGGEEVEVCYGIRSSVPNSAWGKHLTSPFVFDRQGHMDSNKHFDLTTVLSTVNCGYDGVTKNVCALCSRVSEKVVPATGNHDAYEVSVCADKCTVCEKYIQKEVQVHSYVEVYEYAQGYLNTGIYANRCKNEGCSYCVETVKEALIVDLGFSVPNAKLGKGINYGFKINKKLVEEYETVNNCHIKLGVLVSGGENFELDKNVYKHTFNVIHEMLDIVLNFGDTTENDDKEIVLAGYVTKITDESTENYYFQSKTDKETTDYTSSAYGTLYGISYNNAK